MDQLLAKSKKMTKASKYIALTSLILLVISASLMAQDVPNVYDQIGKQQIADLPQGTFSSWSDADKTNVLLKSFKSCLFLCSSAFVAPTASVETMKEENSTCLLSCIAKHLPDDDPREADYQGQAQLHYSNAKRLGSILPPPTFVHEVSTPLPPSAEEIAKTKAIIQKPTEPKTLVISPNPTEIPWVGHFSLSPGHKSFGIFGTQHVEVSVDTDGQEHFLADGKEVDSVEGPRVSGAGNSELQVAQENDDKSVHFIVWECLPLPQNGCADSQKGWEYIQTKSSK